MHKDLLFNMEEFKTAEKYWTSKFSGHLTEVRLLRDFSDTRQCRKKNSDMVLEPSLTEGFQKLCKNNELSRYILFLSAFNVLISKYVGHDDIIVVSPVYAPKSQKYNKHVPLRNNVSNSNTFKELVIRVKETVRDGYKNEHYSINYLNDLLDLKKAFSFSRLIFLSHSIHNKESITAEIDGDRNDLTVSMSKDGDRLEFRYNVGLFRAETIRQLMNSYSYILEQVLDHIDIRISHIALLETKEKKRLLARFNNTQKEFPADTYIQELFRHQVTKHPEKTAVRSTIDRIDLHDQLKTESLEVSLSYEELNSRSNQLAAQLREQGVTANSIVGLMLRHPLETAVCIMGVLKAGGAYLPMDHTHPENALQHILADSNTRWLVTEESLLEKIPETPTQISIITLDDFELADYPETNPEIVNKSPNSAYVIYTSGTTGKPKGTLVQHQGVVNYTLWRIETYGCNPRDVTLQPLSYCFDGFNSNFYTTLFSGGELYIVPDSKRLDPLYIRDVIVKQRITNVSLVPGIYRSLLESADKDELESIRLVVLAGDTCDSGLI
ncbi:MAG: AMP-binding protein, partial [bacterium]|nr:AMP-binding protein [bacterium]